MSAKTNKYRLVTQADFDGMVCSVLLTELGIIDDTVLVASKDIQNGSFVPGGHDILANLPYHKNAYLVFDHHIGEMLRVGNNCQNLVINPGFSSARVIHSYFNGNKKCPLFPRTLLECADNFAYARFSMDDILHPKDWVLINFLIDHRTRLDKLKEFKMSHEKFFGSLCGVCVNTPISDIMEMSCVRDRANTYFNHQNEFKVQLRRCSMIVENVSVVDYTGEDTVYIGNRFMIYAMFPKTELSVHITKNSDGRTVTFACGKSVLNRGNPVNIGEIMRKYGGGGHSNAGAFRVDIAFKEQIQQELLEQLIEGGY